MRPTTYLGLAMTALATVAVVQPAQAAERRAFTTAAFQAAQREGRPILIDVYAPWCPVCAKQQPVIERLSRDPANQDLVVFKIDFDKQKTEWRNMKVTRQSTLIAFDGTRETGRLLGSTDAEEISRLVASTRG